MILEAFEKALASKWDETLFFETEEEAEKPRTHPVPVAFMALEKATEKVKNGEVIIDDNLEQHWRVLEKEYSISRQAAQILMMVARKYPSIVRIGNLGTEMRMIGVRAFVRGLEELTEAGVLDKSYHDTWLEYELSHDLLASVVFENNFAEMWRETKSLRATAENLFRYSEIEPIELDELSDTEDNQPF